MTVKALKKQLMAAIAMVVVSAIALSSSTYAWFVSSNTVTAEGMKVTAQTESGLVISYDGDSWQTTATASMDSAKALYPTSTKDLITWYHASAETYNAAAAKTGSRKNVTNNVFGAEGNTFDPANNYVVMKEFKIKSSSETALSSGLYVESVTVTAPEKTMSTSLRVGVSYTTSGESPTTTYKIYGPVKVGTGEEVGNKATDNYDVYDANDASVGKVVLNTVGQSDSTLISGSTNIPYLGNGVTVKIFIWFEGEDANLNSYNYNAEDLDVSVVFSSIGA